MVLDNAVDSDAADEFYNPPPSSPDPYSNPDMLPFQFNSLAAPYPIDLASIPSPAPILGSLLGRGKQRVANELQNRLAVMSAFQQRRLSQDEVDAFTYHIGKANVIASWGFPLGIMVGLYRANKTKEKYGSPFTGPMKSENGWFDGQRVKFLGREVLRGENARVFVHSLRTFNHMCLHAGLVGIVAAIYATTVQYTGEVFDPRLKDFFRTLKEKPETAAKYLEKTKGALQGPGFNASATMEKLKAQAKARAPETSTRARTAAATSPVFNADDASPMSAEVGYDEFVSDDNTPMSGTNDDAYRNTNTDKYNEPGAGTDTYNQTQNRTQNQTQVRKPTSRSPQNSSRTPPRYPRSDNKPSSLPPDNSSPSPSPSFSSSSPSSSSSASSDPDDGPALSAWERIRQNAASGDSKWPSEKE